MITSIEKLHKDGVKGVKKVLVYFNGSFPKKSYPIKDTTLPVRLFPEANEFIIRCSCTEDTVAYFKKYYPSVNKIGEPIKLRFLKPDFSNWEIAIKNTDVAYAPWIGFDGYQQSISDFKIKYHMFMLEYKNPIYMFINEPMSSSIKSFLKYLEEDENRLFENKAYYDKMYPKMDEFYKNVNFMPNDTPFVKSSDKPWWFGKVKLIAEHHDIHVTPIPDNIIYDLPKADELKSRFANKDYSEKRGIWLGTCFDSRLKRFNELFITPGLLKMDIRGRGTYKVNLYGPEPNDSNNNVDNTELPKIFSEHEWSIYISRGKFTNMLGATFYEPLLNGLPQLIDENCDPLHEIFPTIPGCYFSTENELAQNIKTLDLRDVWIKQVEYLF